MIRKWAGWTLEFSTLFVRTIAWMLVFTVIRTLFGKALDPFENWLFDTAGLAGSIPRLIAVLLVFGFQWLLSFKVTMYLAKLYYCEHED